MDAPMWIIFIIDLLLLIPYLISSSISRVDVLSICGLSNLLYHLLLRPGLYVAGLVVTTQGAQDGIAIAFYIITALQAINIVKWFIHYVVSFVSALKK